MSGSGSVADRVLEFAVFIPVGVAVTVAEEFPALAEKGRRQVDMARTIGMFALAGVKNRFASSGRTPTGGAAKPPTSSGSESGRSHPPGEKATRTARRPPSRAASASQEGSGGDRSVPPVGSLPIPGYDTLAASQVVQRLSSLRPDELEAVRRYEVATRGRRTILHRIGQLTAGDDPSSA